MMKKKALLAILLATFSSVSFSIYSEEKNEMKEEVSSEEENAAMGIEALEKEIAELEKKVRVSKVKARRFEREAHRIQSFDLMQHRRFLRQARREREEGEAYAFKLEQAIQKKAALEGMLEEEPEEFEAQ